MNAEDLMRSGYPYSYPAGPFAGSGPSPGMGQFGSVKGNVLTGQGQFQDIYQPMWDRVNYPAAGSAQLTFFNIPVGQSATLIVAGVAGANVKTFRDTSFESANILPTKALSCRGLGIKLIPLQQAVAGAATPSIMDDKMRLYSGGYLQWIIVDQVRLRLPLMEFRNLDPDFASTTANAVTMAGASGVGMGDKYWLDPIDIPANTNINFTLVFSGPPTLIQTFDVVVTLACFERRPVQ